MPQPPPPHTPPHGTKGTGFSAAGAKAATPNLGPAQRPIVNRNPRKEFGQFLSQDFGWGWGYACMCVGTAHCCVMRGVRTDRLRGEWG